ncbi:MAG: hypothetical protein ACRDPQ_17430 [Nocardioidaceae bacterium]
MRIDAPPRGSGTALHRPVLDPDRASLLAAAGDLAVEFAASGSGRIEAELVRFVDAAQRLGADALLGSIVLDRSEPDVVRQRAFGAMHRQVAGLIGAA